MEPTRVPLPQIPGYRIERLLGRGGMGSVFLGAQLSINRQVAIKIPHAARLKNPADVESFIREARAACQLSHPGLVAVHDLIHDPTTGMHACVMEYAPGRTAAQIVDTDGPLPLAQALNFAGQTAAALAHAHAHGFVHRDVKPDNLIVSPHGTVKLVDLGLVHNRIGGLSSSSSTTRNRRLVLVGTPEFAAPEQCCNPEEADETSDVWSLGATLFYLLTGRPPFDGTTVIDLIINAATKPLELPPHLGTHVRQLLETFLAKDPDQRYADATIAGEALAAVAAGRAPLRPDGSARPRRRRLPRRRMR